MPFRFRRTVKIAPGLRLNVGKRGLSLSAGPRGLSVTAGSRGLHGNVGAPGTGFSYRTKLSGPQSSSQPAALQKTGTATVGLQILLHDSGIVAFQDADGSQLPTALERAVKKQHSGVIEEWLQQQCDEINKQIESRVHIHLNTPPPEPNDFKPAPFSESAPQPLPPKPIGIFARFIRPLREKIEKENAEALDRYGRELRDWEGRKAEFKKSEEERRLIHEKLRLTDVNVMQDYLGEVLEALQWPGETDVDFEVRDNGKTVYLDVDLPEIEDFPKKTSTVASRGFKLNMKEVSEAQNRRNYMMHVHGVGLRLAGVTFYSLPAAQWIIISAYSQRPDKATGRINDEYLYSVKIHRPEWSTIDFGGLERVDVIEALGAFEIRRRMTKTGIFKPIEPLSPDS